VAGHVAEQVGAAVDEIAAVNPVDGIVAEFGRAAERGHAHRPDLQPQGKAAALVRPRESAAGIVGAGLQQPGQGSRRSAPGRPVGQSPVNWTRTSAVHRRRRLQQPGGDVVHRAAVARDRRGARTGRRSPDRAAPPWWPRPGRPGSWLRPNPLAHPGQRRGAGQGQHHLAGQAGRGHARLDAGDQAQGRAGIHGVGGLSRGPCGQPSWPGHGPCGRRSTSMSSCSWSRSHDTGCSWITCRAWQSSATGQRPGR
jgi:hypothetical protein